MLINICINTLEKWHLKQYVWTAVCKAEDPYSAGCWLYESDWLLCFGGGIKLMIGCVLGRSASLGLIFLESAKDTVQRHQDLLNIHKLSLCRCRIGDWAEGRGYVSYGAGSRLYCKHTHTHTEIHTTAEHIVHTGLSVTSNAIQENLKINDISWRVTVSGESEVKWLFCRYFKHKSLDCSVILWGDQVDRLIVASIVDLKHITLFVLIYKQLVDICGDYWCAFNLYLIAWRMCGRSVIDGFQ